MDRQIKFRGKRIDNGEWIYGYLSTPIKINCIAEPKPLEVFGLTIGQFTGLKDKNGQDIYEGDVISINWKVPTEKCGARILWSEEEFGWNYLTFGCEYPGNPLLELTEMNEEFEVIGNIHDNPELT